MRSIFAVDIRLTSIEKEAAALIFKQNGQPMFRQKSSFPNGIVRQNMNSHEKSPLDSFDYNLMPITDFNAIMGICQYQRQEKRNADCVP